MTKFLIVVLAFIATATADPLVIPYPAGYPAAYAAGYPAAFAAGYPSAYAAGYPAAYATAATYNSPVVAAPVLSATFPAAYTQSSAFNYEVIAQPAQEVVAPYTAAALAAPLTARSSAYAYFPWLKR